MNSYNTVVKKKMYIKDIQKIEIGVSAPAGPVGIMGNIIGRANLYPIDFYAYLQEEKLILEVSNYQEALSLITVLRALNIKINNSLFILPMLEEIKDAADCKYLEDYFRNLIRDKKKENEYAVSYRTIFNYVKR